MEIRCPHCTHLQIVNAPYSFDGADHKCSCCERKLFQAKCQDEPLKESIDLQSFGNASESRTVDLASNLPNQGIPLSTERWSILNADDELAKEYPELRTRESSIALDEDSRSERLAQNTTFRTTVKETQTPDFFDFLSDDPQSMSNCRLEVLVDLPIERASSDEMSIPVIIKTDLKRVKVAVWLRRDSEIGKGYGDFRYTTNSQCQVGLKLGVEHRQYELCIQAENAKNWFWSVTVPVLRRADVVKIPRYYILDQSRRIDGNSPYLEGYTHNQITIADNAPVEATSRQFGLILEPTPRKKRARRVVPSICRRRKRAVSEFTLKIESDQWHLHGGLILTFGRDKPLPNRNNMNDILFRPHHDDEICKQVSQTHGVFEVHSHSIRYRHSDFGTNQQKRTVVLLPKEKEYKVRQPEVFEVPDPYQKVRFWPLLAVSRDESQVLEVQAWRNRLSDDHHYVSGDPANAGEQEFSDRRHAPGGMRLSVVDSNGQTVRRHYLIAQCLVIGSSDDAQIQCVGTGVHPFHAYIHWIDNHLWLEPCTRACQVHVNGEPLDVDHLFPLMENTTIVLGQKTILEVLHFG